MFKTKTIPKIIFGFLIFVSFTNPLNAQTLLQDTHEIKKAKVIKIINEEEIFLDVTNTKTFTQEISFILLDTPNEIHTTTNDFIKLKEGQIFYANKITKTDGTIFYSISEPYRIPTLFIFLAIFLLVAILFGGKQGFRGLISLLVSIFVIFWFLLPQILSGTDPILISILSSSFIIILGSYITHGFNKTTTTAVIGMISTILFTGLLALIAVQTSNLSGFSSDEAVYLNFNTMGNLNFKGLLFGGILIGLLGILYDAAISQAVIVEELHNANKLLSKKTIYKKAIRIGKEHIGALVDTLAIAYVGASLPLFLFFFSVENPSLLAVINREIFATEIIRILIGSIGVIMTVPITTFISTLLIVKKPEIGYIPKQENPEIHHHH